MTDPYAWLGRMPTVQLQFARLPDDEMGGWIPEHDIVVLDDRLTQVERRCTLAHELLHRLHDDDPSLPPHLLEQQERQCRERAARLLIKLSDLFDALLWSWQEQEDEIAEQLWVDIPTLRDRLATLTPEELLWLREQLFEAREEAA